MLGILQLVVKPTRKAVQRALSTEIGTEYSLIPNIHRDGSVSNTQRCSPKYVFLFILDIAFILNMLYITSSVVYLKRRVARTTARHSGVQACEQMSSHYLLMGHCAINLAQNAKLIAQ